MDVRVYLTTPRSSEHHEIEKAIKYHFNPPLDYEEVHLFLHRRSNQLVYRLTDKQQLESLLAYLHQLEANGRISEVFIREEVLQEEQREPRDPLHLLTLALQTMGLADVQNSFQSQEVVKRVITTLIAAQQQLKEKEKEKEKEKDREETYP